MLKITLKQPTHLKMLVFLLMFALLLAACGGGAEPTQPPNNDTEAAEQPAATEAPVEATEPAAQATEPAAEATEPPADGELPGAPSFSADIQPIFSASCASCHGSRASGGVQLDTYENLMASNVVTAGDAAGSVLWQVVDNGRMPKAGQPLSPEQVQLIADWINAGANND